MAKAKSSKELKDLMEKRYNKKKEQLATKAKEEVKQEMQNNCYTVLQDPDSKSRQFLIAKIKFDVKTMKAVVDNYVKLDQDVIGLRYPVQQQDLEFYYKQANKKEK